MKSFAIMVLLLGMTAGVYASDASKSPLEASLVIEKAPYACVAGADCKIMLSFTNTGSAVVKLDKWDASLKPNSSVSLTTKVESGAATEVKAGETASATVTTTLPESTANSTLTFVCSVQADGKDYNVDLPVYVTPKYEITLFPTRLILSPGTEPKTLGLSVINHTESEFNGKVSVSPYKGIAVTPAEINTKIDPLGLEVYLLNVKPDGNPAPGHYAVWVDVDGKSKEWAAVDVPVVAKKAAVKVDGKLDEWKDAQAVSVRRVVDGKSVEAGKARFAYDAKNLYVAFEVTDANHDLSEDSKSRANANPPSDSVVIAFDTLFNGAKEMNGGYKDDDVEFMLLGAEGGSVLLKTAVGSKKMEKETGFLIAFRRDGEKSIYEALIPLTEIRPKKAAKDSMFGISVLVNDSDGKNVTTYEFGGGIAGKVDPRLFVPVVMD